MSCLWRQSCEGKAASVVQLAAACRRTGCRTTATCRRPCTSRSSTRRRARRSCRPRWLRSTHSSRRTSTCRPCLTRGTGTDRSRARPRRSASWWPFSTASCSPSRAGTLRRSQGCASSAARRATGPGTAPWGCEEGTCLEPPGRYRGRPRDESPQKSPADAGDRGRDGAAGYVAFLTSVLLLAALGGRGHEGGMSPCASRLGRRAPAGCHPSFFKFNWKQGCRACAVPGHHVLRASARSQVCSGKPCGEGQQGLDGERP